MPLAMKTIEASVVEIFESHRNHPWGEELMQLEQGNLQEWGGFYCYHFFRVIK